MTMKAATLAWNLVTENLPENQLLQKKIRVKITKLEKHLVHFPEGTVHLHIALGRHREKEYYTARLTLRVPSNILHFEKSADDVIKAFDDALEALLRELEKLQSNCAMRNLGNGKNDTNYCTNSRPAALVPSRWPKALDRRIAGKSSVTSSNNTIGICCDMRAAMGLATGH